MWRGWTVLALLTCLAAAPASAGVITFDNQSDKKVKLAAPGGGAVLDPGSGPRDVSFDGQDAVGLDVNIWWVANPRELCQIYTPFDRIVVISGKTTIRCRSRDR